MQNDGYDVWKDYSDSSSSMSKESSEKSLSECSDSIDHKIYKLLYVLCSTFFTTLITIITLDLVFFRDISVDLNGNQDQVSISSIHIILYFIISIFDYMATFLIKLLIPSFVNKRFYSKIKNYDKIFLCCIIFLLGTIKNIIFLSLIIVAKLNLDEYKNMDRNYESIIIISVCMFSIFTLLILSTIKLLNLIFKKVKSKN